MSFQIKYHVSATFSAIEIELHAGLRCFEGGDLCNLQCWQQCQKKKRPNRGNSLTFRHL